ncbi:MAG TPA: hypothetical protein V6C76_02955 [Drouetiella sp.]
MPPEFNAIKAPELPQQQYAFEQKHQRAEHGLLTEALDTVFDAFPGKSKSTDSNAKSSGTTASEVVAGFVKAVPLFMGPGRGMLLAAALNGLDEVHRGDSTGTQLEDFALGGAKGAASKLVMDKIGGNQSMSLMQRGLAIGGSTAFIDSALTRSTWTNSTTGQLDFTGGLEKTALNTTFGAGVGMAAFPIGGALSNRITPAAEKILGTTFAPSMVRSVTTGGAFGFTSGVVGETAAQLYAGKFDPYSIATHGLVEGLSTAAAGGVGHRFSTEYSLARLDANSKPASQPDVQNDTNNVNFRPENTLRIAPSTEDLVAQTKLSATDLLAKPGERAVEREVPATRETEQRPGVEVDNRPVAESDRARVEKEWEATKLMSSGQLAQAKDMARQELADIQIEPGKSAWDVIENSMRTGAIADPDAVMKTIAMAREHFTSLRTADGSIIPDQAANWVHTMGELARVAQYSDIVRSNAVAQSGETDPVKAQAIADAAMSPEATKLAMIASAGSDSTKSQAAEYMRLNADGTVDKANLPANFHTHHLEAVLAMDGIRSEVGLNQREFDLVKNAMLAHQVAPAETIMGMLYNFKIGPAVAGIQKAAESGDISKLAPWVQEEIKADPEFPQKLAAAYARETRPMRDPAAESVTGQITPQAHGMKVISAIADTGYLLMPPAEVPAGANVPKVKMTADGKGWELDVDKDTQNLLRLAGDGHWYVPHQPTAAERSAMTPEQVKYFDDLWKVSQGVFAGDNGQYGARESVYKYVAALRGPGTNFHDSTVWDSIKSIDTSRTDVRRILDQPGRQVLDETNAKTSQVFDRQNGTFRQRADQALIKEFGITLDGKSPEELQAILKRSGIYNTEHAAQGTSPAESADYAMAQRILDTLNKIPYYGTPITEADYKDATRAYQTAIRVKNALGDAARREASMNPDQTSDNFQSVRQRTSRGN